MKSRTLLWDKAVHICACLLVLVAGIALMLLLPAVTHATAATTQHEIPILSSDPKTVTWLCRPTSGYTCTPGYTSITAQKYKWVWDDYGCPNYASGCPNTPHNCTLYAAYRLAQNGVTLDWHANADDWDTEANANGFPVNQTPAVGAIAQWNGPPPPKSTGHVAYVESVAYDNTGNVTSITLTMDDYDTQNPYPLGYTAEVKITAPSPSHPSPAWPDNFIHFKDQSTTSQPAYYAGKIVQWNNGPNTPKTSWLVSWDLKRYWIPDSSTYNCLTSKGFVNVGPLSSTRLDELPDQDGKWASCGSSTMGVNQYLFRGSYLKSSNGYTLVLQRSNGYLVLNGPNGKPIWTIAHSSDYLVLQGDNNLVAYGYGVGATWGAGTVNSGATKLEVTPGGKIELLNKSGKIVWSK